MDGWKNNNIIERERGALFLFCSKKIDNTVITKTKNIEI